MGFTDSDISEFLSELIELGGVHFVDRDSNKLIRDPDGNTYTLNNGDRVVDLAVYGSVARDVAIVNPFADGGMNNEQSLWFYSSRNEVLSGLLAKAVMTVIEIIAKANKTGSTEKKGKKGKSEDTTDAIARAAGTYASSCALLINENMVDEFRLISSDWKNFAKIYYNKSKRRAEFKCSLFSELEKRTLVESKKVKAKDWEPIQSIVLKVLGVEDVGQLVTDAKIHDMPAFDSICRLYVEVLGRLSKPLKTLANIDLDTSKVEGQLGNLEAYYQKAKWCVAPTFNNNSNAQQTPWQSQGGPAPSVPQQNNWQQPNVYQPNCQYNGPAPSIPQQNNWQQPNMYQPNGSCSGPVPAIPQPNTGYQQNGQMPLFGNQMQPAPMYGMNGMPGPMPAPAVSSGNPFM